MDIYPKISLIFVNYRSVFHLTKALESLFYFEKESNLFEVIVVNNDSSESEALLELHKKFQFFLIQNNRNRGFGAGNNIGAKRAQGSILGFINPDIIWTGKHLSHIEELFHEKKEMGVLGMRILDKEGEEEEWSLGKSPSLARLLKNNMFFQRKELSPEWVSGGALFIRKDLFSSLFGFDEQFFLYFEDVDLCRRVLAEGFSVLSSSQFSLIHLGGQSKHSTILQKQQFYASQKKYFKKHRPAWESKTLVFFHWIKQWFK